MKKFIIEEQEKSRILNMHKEATEKHYLNIITESEKGLITEVTTLTTDELKGLNSMWQESKKNGEIDFMFVKPSGKNLFSIRAKNSSLFNKDLTYLLIPPSSMPSVELVGVNSGGCFHIRIKKGELPVGVRSMRVLETLVTVNVVNNTTKKLEPPKFSYLSFDNEAHGYEKDEDTILQLKTCASFENLMKFADKLKSNGWKGAQSTVPVINLTAGISLV
jgi:hypothetical protein